MPNIFPCRNQVLPKSFLCMIFDVTKRGSNKLSAFKNSEFYSYPNIPMHTLRGSTKSHWHILLVLMFCQHQKGGDCWPHEPSINFDVSNTLVHYLYLICCSKCAEYRFQRSMKMGFEHLLERPGRDHSARPYDCWPQGQPERRRFQSRVHPADSHSQVEAYVEKNAPNNSKFKKA